MRRDGSETTPISCTLSGKNLQERLLAIAELMRDSLQRFERRGLILDLTFVGTAAERVREMVRKEQDCCAFLKFDLREGQTDVRLTITVPEKAREAADILFEQFVGSYERRSGIVTLPEGERTDETAR